MHPQLEVDDKVIKDPKVILNQERLFYKKLYSETSCNQSNLNNLRIKFTNQNYPKLTTDAQDKCEVNINESSCGEALRQMKNRKSPGIDGLPADFYKFFWKNIKHMVTNSIASAYEKGSLSNNKKNRNTYPHSKKR
jgi:hypothetical protein